MKKIQNIYGLPNLPVPELKGTLKKFVRSAEPFLTEVELKRTKEVVERFQTGVGPELQKVLVAKAEETENWLEDWWLNDCYLDLREPVVIYSNPGLVFPEEKFEDETERLLYTSKLIIAALHLKTLIDTDGISIDKMGEVSLDMNQYKKVFGTCRIPGKPSDTLQFNSDSNHIVIVRNNNFFKLNVLNSDNELPSVKQLLYALNRIIKQSELNGSPVGILTTQNRDSWHEIYGDLLSDSQNRASVEEIQKALFLVCLDRQMAGPSYKTTAGLHSIHGGGSKLNSANRWYDKTLQFVVSENGVVALNYEHSPSDGQPIAVMGSYIMTNIKDMKWENLLDTKHNLEVRKLEFNINEQIKNAINNSSTIFDKLVANFELESFHFTDFGKNFIKSKKLSPDSFIQMAIQHAFYRIHKVPGAHYEAGATRMFIHGRTETIRSCSNESIAFAKTMMDESKSYAEKVSVLQVAVENHKNYTVQALQGFGVDRHLLGLKLAARQLNVDVSEFYSDSAYTRSTYMRLITSQVSNKYDGYMCFGPVTPDGYCCCYNPRDNDINFGITSFKVHPDVSAKNFKIALETSLCEMKNVLCNI